jgi:hypothetical protein
MNRNKIIVIVIVVFMCVTAVFLVKKYLEGSDNDYKVKNGGGDNDVQRPDEGNLILQGFSLKMNQEVGGFRVVFTEYEPFGGVVYELAKKEDNEIAILAKIRVYCSRREALESTKKAYRHRYNAKNRKGNHLNEEFIGDFSFVCDGTLTFVRRNVKVFLVDIEATKSEVVELSRLLQAEIDKHAKNFGQKMVVLPKVDIRFKRIPKEGDLRKVEVFLSVPDNQKFKFDVVSTEGDVQVEENHAVVERKSEDRAFYVLVSVISASGFVFRKEYRE